MYIEYNSAISDVNLKIIQTVVCYQLVCYFFLFYTTLHLDYSCIDINFKYVH